MKKMFLFVYLLVSSVLILPLLGVKAEGETIRYIKNSYTGLSYLYEEEGILKYGIPISKDVKEFKWVFVEKTTGVYEIKNLATNHSITLFEVGASTTTYCKSFVEDDSFYWKVNLEVDIDESQAITNYSSEYSGIALHMEGVTNGNCASEAIDVTFGNARWLLYTEEDINFEASIRDGFCIGTDFDDRYLFVEGNNISFGTPTESNEYYIWNFEVLADGSKGIKNMGSGKYLSLANYSAITHRVNLADSIGDQEKFTFNPSVLTEIKSSSSSYQLTVEDGENGVLTASESIVNADSSNFRIVPASQVPVVLGDYVLGEGTFMFQNSWFLMYMIEDNGVPTYGNVGKDDERAQWELKYDETSGLSALVNKQTGHYLHTLEGELACDETESYYWKVLRSKNDLYPNAIIFQDSTNSSIYLHMENLLGTLQNSNSVQPTWGSPHWEVSRSTDNETDLGTESEIDTSKFYRLLSLSKKNIYFFETNGGYSYGSSSEKDGRSHFKFVDAGNNGYYLWNRQYELYVSTLGNGFLTGVEDTESATVFHLMKRADGTYLLQERNDNSYLSTYLNIYEGDGFTHNSLVSGSQKTSLWMLEVGLDEIDSSGDVTTQNVVLSSFKEDMHYTILDRVGEYGIEHYGNLVRVFNYETMNYLKVTKNKVVEKPYTNDYDSSFYFNYSTFEDKISLKNNVNELILQPTSSSREFSFETGFIKGVSSTITINVFETKEYDIELFASDKDFSTTLYVDDVNVDILKFTEEKMDLKLSLTKGLHTITISRSDYVKKMVIHDVISNNYQGATSNTLLVEAEGLDTNGTILDYDTTYRTIASESSNRSAVSLNKTAQNIKYTIPGTYNGLVLRYSVPDTEDGLGDIYSLSLYVNNEKVTTLGLSSKHTNLYGAFPWTNNVADGDEHVFYDEATYIFSEPLKEGDVIKLQKDFTDEASYYIIDYLEFETVNPAIEIRSNAVSITEFGAIPNDSLDDSQAIIDAIAAAAKSRKEVYIPSGVFECHKEISITNNNVTIRGAGYWHSEIRGVNFKIKGNNVSFYDIKFTGDANTRRDTIDFGCIEILGNNEPNDLVVANCWISHYKVGLWLNFVDDVFISGNRIRYTYADGINLHAGVKNAVVEQNNIRSTGDDGIAEWSDGTDNTGITIRYNTVENPWLANCVALYGGKDIRVHNNILKDTVYAGSGVNISTNFLPTNFKGFVNVYQNLIERCGSDNSNMNVGGIWFNIIEGYDSYATITVSDNVVKNSLYQGISFSGTGTIWNLTISGNVVTGSSSYGVEFGANYHGYTLFKNNQVSQSSLDDIFYGYNKLYGEVNEVVDEVIVNIDNNNQKITILYIVSGVLGLGAIGISALIVVRFKKRRGLNA